jgi:cell division protein FtsB
MNKKKLSPGRKLWLKTRWYIIFLLSVSLIYYVLTGNYGFIKLYELTSEKAALIKKINRLNAEIDSLKIISKKLDSDSQYIEKIAREKYNMIKKGETVYQMVPADH